MMPKNLFIEHFEDTQLDYIFTKNYHMKPQVAIINGPNLNLVGNREPNIYGNLSFEEALNEWQTIFNDIELILVQSNMEGQIINYLHEFGLQENMLGIVLNAGAYSHTSIAIADAIGGINKPVIGVHMSNIFQREKERHTDLLVGKCIGHITGFGMNSYQLAIQYLVDKK